MIAKHTLSPLQNATNAALTVLVTIPACWYAWFIKHRCPVYAPGPIQWTDLQAWVTSEQWCSLSNKPLLAVNVVFFLNVCVLFWLISLLQGSTWLIDPYWTIVPVLIGIFYEYHPDAAADNVRSAVVMFLLYAWSIRLTHSYFRREKWTFGAREDWRFSELKSRLQGHWWWASFFVTYVSQQLMLVGITLPMYAVHSSPEPWDPLVDTAIALVCAAGIIIAFNADNELHEFVDANDERRHHKQAPVLLLDSGIWHYSRHPNYFGEQLWWWGLALWAVMLGKPWMVVGTAFNTLCMIPITMMTEARMKAKPERVELFEQYKQTTSAWVPWFKSQAGSVKEE